MRLYALAGDTEMVSPANLFMVLSVSVGAIILDGGGLCRFHAGLLCDRKSHIPLLDSVIS